MTLKDKGEEKSKELKKASKKAAEKLGDALENIKNTDVPAVKKAVKKAAEKVADAAEKVESELKGKKNAGGTKKLLQRIKTKGNLYVEYDDKQTKVELIHQKLVEKLEEMGFEKEIKTLSIYFKVEEQTAYCVVNEGEPIAIHIAD